MDSFPNLVTSKILFKERENKYNMRVHKKKIRQDQPYKSTLYTKHHHLNKHKKYKNNYQMGSVRESSQNTPYP